MLGLFVGLRARYERDVDQRAEAERDYLLSRYLFPAQRLLCREQLAATARCNVDRFESLESGHPRSLAALAREVLTRCRGNGWTDPDFAHGGGSSQ
jgi:hypothetical protein